MTDHLPSVTRLGWEPYLGAEASLVSVRLLGRYPIRVQDFWAPAVFAMEAALTYTGYENPCDYIGSYMKRPIAGSTYWSWHSYGGAVDLDYGGDTDGDGDPTIDKNPHLHRPLVDADFGVNCQLVRWDVEAIESILTGNGQPVWRWLGWSIGDTMHFEPACSPADARTGITFDPEEKDVTNAYNDFVAGWVTGLAEDKTKTEQEFVRLNTVPAADGGFILEPANNPATVAFWVALLDHPFDPQWRGFFARTGLSTWGR